MKLSESAQKFLNKVGERNAAAFRDNGRPTPEPIYDLFKVLSMLEVSLRFAGPNVLSKVNEIADWQP